MRNLGKGTILSSTKEDAKAPSTLLQFIALINANAQKLQTRSVLFLCLVCSVVVKLVENDCFSNLVIVIRFFFYSLFYIQFDF